MCDNIKLQFKHNTRIDKSIDEVFNAVTDPDKLSCYFVESSSGSLQQGKSVDWYFTGYEGPIPIDVEEVVENRKIVCSWPACNGMGHKTQFTFTFEPDGKNQTKVSIEEKGWETIEQQELDSFYEQCSGWTEFLDFLKARLEHNVELRNW